MTLLEDLIELSEAPHPRRPARTRNRGAIVGMALAATAFVLMLVSLPGMAGAEPSPLGLLFAAPPIYAAAIVIAPLAFCIALAAGSRSGAWTSLIATVLVLRLPVTLATDMPLYSWTYKHFGVIDYIQTTGELARGVDIYHSWPGAFALIAWFNQLTGADTLTIAHWFTPAFQLAFTLAVYVVARSFGLTRESSMVAALIAQLVNWVAQDYLSPQAIALFLALAVIALVVNSRRHKAAPWVALVVFAGITVAHQLTPYWLVAIVVALSVLGYLRPRWIALLFIGIAIAYLLANVEIVSSYGSLLSFNPFQNLQTNGVGHGSAGQQVASLAGRATTLALWGGAAVAFVVSLIRSRRTRRRTLAAGAIAFASFALVLGQGYGGEAIFRVMLYSIPGCALLVAPAITAMLLGPVRSHRPVDAPLRIQVKAVVARRRRRRRLTQLVAVPIVSALALVSAQAYYGGWFANKVTRESYEASTDILRTADPYAIMVGLAPGAPGRTIGRYVEFARINAHFDLGVEAWEGWLGSDFRDPQRVTDMTDDLLYSGQPTFVVITSQMKAYSDYYGLFPPGAVDRFEQQLVADGRWIVRRSTPTLTVVELNLEAAHE